MAAATTFGIVRGGRRLVLSCALVVGAGCRPEATPPPPTPACAPRPARPDGLIVAGSGSNVAPVRAVARRYRATGAPRVRVPDSIGTAGGLRALADGAIDVALTSRPLSDDERRAGLVETPFARVPVAVVVHPDAGVRDVTRAELVAIFRGERDRWPNGMPIVPLLREEGDSGNELIAGTWPDVWLAIADAVREGRFTTCYTDQEMAETLAGTAGAIGFLDVGTVRLTHPELRTVAVDGIPPTPASGTRGDPPLVKTLAFVTLGPPAGDAERFLRYATSVPVRERLARYGYLSPPSS